MCAGPEFTQHMADTFNNKHASMFVKKYGRHSCQTPAQHSVNSKQLDAYLISNTLLSWNSIKNSVTLLLDDKTESCLRNRTTSPSFKSTPDLNHF